MNTECYTIYVCLPLLPAPDTYKPITYNNQLAVEIDPEYVFVDGHRNCICTLNNEPVKLSLFIGQVIDCLGDHEPLKFHVSNKPHLIRFHWDRTQRQGVCIIATISGLVHGHNATACYPGKYPFLDIEQKMRAFHNNLAEPGSAYEHKY